MSLRFEKNQPGRKNISDLPAPGPHNQPARAPSPHGMLADGAGSRDNAADLGYTAQCGACGSGYWEPRSPFYIPTCTFVRNAEKLQVNERTVPYTAILLPTDLRCSHPFQVAGSVRSLFLGDSLQAGAPTPHCFQYPAPPESLGSPSFLLRKPTGHAIQSFFPL